VAVGVGLTLYIATVTWVSSRETHGWRMDRVFYLPLTAGGLCLIVAWGRFGPHAALWQVAVSGALGAWFVVRGWRLAKGVSAQRAEPRAVQRFAGASIRGLILMQAAFLLLGVP